MEEKLTSQRNTRVTLAIQKVNGLYRKCARHLRALLRAIGFWFLDAPLTVLGTFHTQTIINPHILKKVLSCK